MSKIRELMKQVAIKHFKNKNGWPEIINCNEDGEMPDCIPYEEDLCSESIKSLSAKLEQSIKAEVMGVDRYKPITQHGFVFDGTWMRTNKDGGYLKRSDLENLFKESEL